jgi:hypothetical protein
MGGGHAGKEAPFEDRRMWRLLLARLHPDAGGAHELFLFACALKEEVCGGERLVTESVPHRGRSTEPFLHTWQDAMSYWASHNRDALKRSRSQRGSMRDRRA